MHRRLSPFIASKLARFRTALEGRFGARLRELVLYGSYARGEANEDSDVDVLVVVEGLTLDERVEVIRLAHVADAADDEAVGLHPLPYSTAQVAELRAREKRLLMDIGREGIRL
jgi:predicted nucleotidyltransferase